jgi:RNA polymerase sigma-70 factor (ECF subfamily)
MSLPRRHHARAIPSTFQTLWNDEELIPRVQAGDSGAFEYLFKRYYSALYAFVCAYVDSAETAEEVVQDVFLRTWEHRARWEPRGPVQTYLYKSARNRALDLIKHRKVERLWSERVRSNRAHGSLPFARSADDAVHAEELEVTIARTLAALPERCRLIFLMSREHDLSYGQIAEVLDISVKTVETQIGRALKMLRKNILPWTE